MKTFFFIHHFLFPTVNALHSATEVDMQALASLYFAY